MGQVGLEERQQAMKIDVLPGTIDGSQALVLPHDASEPVHMVKVINASDRPIRNVTSKIEATPVGATVTHDKLADMTGEMEQVQSSRPGPSGRAPRSPGPRRRCSS